MKKNLTRIACLLMALLMMFNTLCLTAMADALPEEAADEAMSLEYICGLEEHLHDAGCRSIICGMEEALLTCESEEHTHDDLCWDHVHGEDCMTALCGMEETEGHTHSEDCMALVCGMEETEEHTHDEGCTEIVCGLEESEGHTHTEACLALGCGVEPQLICETAEHLHGEACFTAHEHTEDCFEGELLCGLEEHTHSDLCMGIAEMKETTELNTVWYGDEVSVDIAAGQNGYNFISVYPGRAYEMSNHMVSADGEHHDIPQTLILAPADEDYTWTPNGLYTFAKSNYEVLYCCDAETGYENGIYYKRMNLEDSSYYDDDAAARIRAIVTNSYPFVSMEKMKRDLKAEGFADAELLTRAEIISGVQMAIWSCSNDTDMAYSRTFDVPSNVQWGTVFHDFTNEMNVWWQTGKRKFSESEEVGNRINALAKHLASQTAIYPEKNQIIISEIDILEAEPIMEKAGYYQVLVRVALNSSGSSDLDTLQLTATIDGEAVKTKAVEYGTEVYTFVLEVMEDQLIEVTVSGSQILPSGVYFYEPEGGRNISQSVVGVAKGKTEVYASAEVKLPIQLEENDPFSIELVKTGMDGMRLPGAEFSLNCLDEDGNPQLLGTYLLNSEDAALTIDGLYPDIRYSLTETKAPEGYAPLSSDIRFHLTENGEVVLDEPVPQQVSVNGTTLTVANHPFTQLTVKKVWKGDSAKTRPESVTVQLYCDGTAYGEAVVLSAENNWTHTWLNLDSAYEWTVKEVNVPDGYRVSTSTSGTTVTITNTKKKSSGGGGGGGGGNPTPKRDYFIIDEPPVPLGALPPTGMSWAASMAAGLAGLAAAGAEALRRKFGRKEDDE